MKKIICKARVKVLKQGWRLKRDLIRNVDLKEFQLYNIGKGKQM